MRLFCLSSLTVETEVPGWRAGDTSIDLTQARSFVTVGWRGVTGVGNALHGSGSVVHGSYNYLFEPRQVQRGVAMKVEVSSFSLYVSCPTMFKHRARAVAHYSMHSFCR